MEDSYIFPGDGASHTRVTFRYVVFRPFEEEIIEGVLKSSDAEGIRGMHLYHDLIYLSLYTLIYCGGSCTFTCQIFLTSKSYVGVEHLIALLTPQCFQIPLMPRMFPVWDFVVGIFARKALLNSGRVLSTLSC